MRMASMAASVSRICLDSEATSLGLAAAMASAMESRSAERVARRSPAATVVAREAAVVALRAGSGASGDGRGIGTACVRRGGITG